MVRRLSIVFLLAALTFPLSGFAQDTGDSAPVSSETEEAEIIQEAEIPPAPPPPQPLSLN